MRAWISTVVANGDTVSAAREVIVRAFVAADMASGAWYLTDDYWPLWGENSVQALTSLKQLRLATVTAAPTFTTDRGYAFDGTTQYINTGFIPSSHAIAYTSAQQRIAVYERTNLLSAGTSAMGVTVATNNRASLQPRTTTTLATGHLNTTVTAPTWTLPVNTSAGMTAISRAASATTLLSYKNGVRLTDSTGLTATSNIQNIALFLGANNNAGTANQFRANSIGFACIGAPLSDAQEAAQYAAVQAFATAVGAQV